MNLGVVIDGNKRFIAELLDDWGAMFHTECLDFTPLKLPFLSTRINDRRYRATLLSFLRRNDVVFFEWAASQLAYASHLNSGTPLVARLHSWELFAFAEQVRWDAVSRIVLVSEAMRRNFVARFPDQSAKAEVVYPGKSLSRFQAGPQRFGGRIGMVCDLVPIKRVYETILMLYGLTQRGYDLTLHLAGSPADDPEGRRYLASLERTVQHLGLSDRVIFHGWLADPSTFLQSIDIFISNSYWEGMQNALVEAMAAGCYCLSHFWEGVEELLPGELICITPKDMEDRIAAYCDCPDDRKWSHQGKLRGIVERQFSMPDMLTRMRAVVMQAGGMVPHQVATNALPSSPCFNLPSEREPQPPVAAGDQD